MDIIEHRIDVGEIQINTAVIGDGPPIILLHGFPHTWRIWAPIIERLCGTRRVIAPDLRGFGESSHAVDGYDAAALANDIEKLTDALGVASAPVIAIDASVAPAFLFAHQHPERVEGLVLMEGTLGKLPGAEKFFSSGPPWWFGFHAVPGLAETVLAGNESSYVDWFLASGTRGAGVPDAIRASLHAAFARRDGLRGPLAYYRALPESAEQLVVAAAAAKLTVPTLAIGAETVGSALADQLRPIAVDLTEALIEDSGHIIPIDQPDALLDELGPFLTRVGGPVSMP
ncbi:alpha/beta fold hydrolase [Microbacterium sp. MPKO10]|uniref:alpha/beta fold hydrolase n=1 Tax=Microbacterium sp. MPKO10 TaxID=2989818 RepID=UPI00223588D0|nr:alpha/beta hydrolase [Microbacterium sp. MPKO10]MCW4457669.1 alpha/beta hydrolase [Microbacterium sp. MPKO10]